MCTGHHLRKGHIHGETGPSSGSTAWAETLSTACADKRKPSRHRELNICGVIHWFAFAKCGKRSPQILQVQQQPFTSESMPCGTLTFDVGRPPSPSRAAPP